MNDGKCDSAGRFFAGTISPQPKDARFLPLRSGRVGPHRIDRHHHFQWARLGVPTTAPCITSTRRRIASTAFDFDGGDRIDQRAAHAHPSAPVRHGGPDGMAVDETGCLWVAQFGGGHAVAPLHAQGRCSTAPSRCRPSLVSCCAFRRFPTLSELYITTASAELEESLRRQQPHAGDLFVASARRQKVCRLFPFGG